MNTRRYPSLIAAVWFSWPGLAGADLPSPVALETERFERERATALQPVIAEHRKRLSAILAELTKAGRVSEALAAAEALKNLQTEGPSTSRAFIGTDWTRGSNAHATQPGVRLEAGGIAKSADGGWESQGLLTHWTYHGNGVLLLTIAKGRGDRLCEVWLLDKQRTSYTGYSFEGLPIHGRLVAAKP